MKLHTAPAVFAAILLGSTAVQAAEVAALTGDNTVSIVDTAKKTVTKTWKIEGVAGKVLGIDVRPADNMLYAIGADGGIYTVDLKTGKATMKSKLEKNVDAKTTVTVDFNPAADRLRLMSSDGTSLRVNVDDGKVTTDGSHKFAETDMHKGEKPNVIAGAYSNSVKGTKETTLYNIDGKTGALVRQAPPNDGVLNAIGKLGVKADTTVAFDIWSDGNGKNEAWLMAGDKLHSVDLATGKATEAMQIKGVSGVRDIAILPAM
jgi:DNA-binding beta-propeller fold protein YncE